MSKHQLASILIVTVLLGCGEMVVEQTSESNTVATSVPEISPGDVAEAPTERVKAEAGVAKQGRSLDNETGVGAIIAQPAKSYFAVKERAVFNIQIPQALQLFKATEGRLPNSHDEFMSKIIKANNIKLPALPEGQTYVFDPEKGELMVEKPSN